MLAFKLLLRNWRSGELKLLSLSLVLAVAVVSGITLFTDRLQSSMVLQANSLLGADVVVNGSHPHSAEWNTEAQKRKISHTEAVLFESMLYAGDEMIPASIKAVSPQYPLRGQFEIGQKIEAGQVVDRQKTQTIPQAGEAWIDSRLLVKLNIQLGDKVAVGDYELVVTQLLAHEPDPFSFNPRLLMNLRDLPLTQAIVAGSRVDYKWLLASQGISSSDSQVLNDFAKWLEPQLTANQIISDVESVSTEMKTALDQARNFLLLTAIMAVLLSGVAIAIAAYQFSLRHTNQVALIKSLGVSAGRIRQLYFGQLFLLGIIGSLVGLALGQIIQQLIASSLYEIVKVELLSPSWTPYALSFVSGILCLLFFALPPLWHLPVVPPLKILRRNLEVNVTHIRLQASMAFVAVLLLILLFSGNLVLAASVTTTIILVVILAIVMAKSLLRVTQSFASNKQSYWQLAFSNIQQRKAQNILLIIVFSIALMLLLTQVIVRSSIINEWQVSLPENSQNTHLMNISPQNVTPVEQSLKSYDIEYEQLYSILRGRIALINGEKPSQQMLEYVKELTWEQAITSASELPKNDKVINGQWWPNLAKNQTEIATPEIARLSIDSKLAERLEVSIGDQLTFSIGGLILNSEIVSIREVDWDTMSLNFSLVFEPGSLDAFSPTYWVSFYLPPEKKVMLTSLLRDNPSIMAYEFDRSIEQLNKLVEQITAAVGLILWLTLIAGCLVLFAAVINSIDSRKQQAGLLRALGSPKKLMLTSVWLEFSILGLISGVIAIIGTETLLLNLQYFALKTSVQPHYVYWLLGPILAAAFIGILGARSCRSVVTTPPMIVLRESQ